ncbi:MAG TPA: DMT family transporter [Actinomycetota bacterium]|nr:DMT family transporter [Actinomycetota bacterium]
MSPRNAALLVIGVIAVSFSAPLIRLADAPPLAIALYRNVFAAAVLVPLALSRHRDEMRSLAGSDWAWLALAGGFLALHFITFIPSVTLTTVAASTVLVSTSAVFAAAGGKVLFGDSARRSTIVGLIIALTGAVLISGGDFRASTRAFLGDLLALSGAVLVAGYFLTGRSLRRRLSLLVYAGIVYSICAVILAAAVLLSGTPLTGYEPKVWLLFGLMALGPQILGHTTFNFLLRDVSATVIAVAVMAEPVGASLLALLFFGEAPSAVDVIGGFLVLAGIYLGIVGEARRPIEAQLE